jgi:hypothetical protein
MKVVLMLSTTLTILLFDGCCPKPTPCPVIPMRCVVPYTPLPDINNTLCEDTDFKCISAKVLTNYESVKEYADTLKSNSEVCK